MLLSLFEAGGILFGLPAVNTAEVLPFPASLAVVPGARWGLLGLFMLRDANVPLLDLPLLCGAKAQSEPGQIVLVAAHGDHLIGLAIHAIRSLTEIDETTMQRYTPGYGDAVPRLFDRSFRDGDRIGYLLEPEILFGLSGVPAAVKPAAGSGANKVQVNSAAPRLFFRAGGLRLGITAAAVDATVPESPISDGPLTSSLCYGTVTYLGRVIPVIDPLVLIGVSAARSQRAMSPAIIVRVPPAGQIALAVDEITSIGTAVAEYPVPSAELGGIDGKMFRSLIKLADSEQHILLDEDALISKPQVDSLSRLSFQRLDSADEAPRSNGGAMEAMNGPGPSESFLFFRSGRRFAVALDQVRHITAKPEDAIAFPGSGRGVLGFFTTGGESALLVDLSALLGLGTVSDSGSARAILLRGLPVQVGILVDDLIAIERSLVRMLSDGVSSAPSVSSSLPPAAMVPLVSDGKSELIEYIDLAALVRENILGVPGAYTAETLAVRAS